MTDAPTWGQVDPDALARIAVVSPHFDDAAMGAGLMLLRRNHTAAAVITVFGGRPVNYPDPPTEWDAAGGFAAGDDIISVRRNEDRAAMSVLGADPVWLDFVDHQYLTGPDRSTVSAVAGALEPALVALEPTAVFVPMGLANPDHDTTHAAAMVVRDAHRDWAWFAYEDQGYKHLPGLLAWRVAKLFHSGVWPTPAIVPISTDNATKRDAIWCYRSQIAPLERDHALSDRLAANVAEQFWRLDAPPAGWEGLADR